jgi:hypothetical protein
MSPAPAGVSAARGHAGEVRHASSVGQTKHGGFQHARLLQIDALQPVREQNSAAALIVSEHSRMRCVMLPFMQVAEIAVDERSFCCDWQWLN